MDEIEIETITIPKLVYDLLCGSALVLHCLKEAGVTQWEGYEGAMDIYERNFLRRDYEH